MAFSFSLRRLRAHLLLLLDKGLSVDAVQGVTFSKESDVTNAVRLLARSCSPGPWRGVSLRGMDTHKIKVGKFYSNGLSVRKVLAIDALLTFATCFNDGTATNRTFDVRLHTFARWAVKEVVPPVSEEDLHGIRLSRFK
jgi:hypothetical protein